MKPINLRKKAVSYRKKGYSYNMICDKLNLKKSTVANWTDKVPYTPNKKVIERIGRAKLKSALFKHKQRMTEIKEMTTLAETELGKVTTRDLWFLGIGLYLGEGTKTHEYVRLINSDPQIIKAAIKWFKEICHLKNENFNPAIHLYPDNNIKKTINYWSKTTGVPKKQFGKTQIDKRINKSGLKKQKLPYGTLHLYIKSCGKKEFGKRLHRRIIGWIKSSLNQINAGIA
ncbi:hypothetical protein KKE19_00670 [Patescibacteria group bacterium]|nr:hypothetical protein [Patescibacteria group bacterium]MBU4274310.1 hypothetical protein [Patescibacteria group bacterium]MBU4367582.1 hypothetical protein [Patescibacteria group bacterium]MBU4461622.1 hypothetical protein [Patescibacteria group bacterium]MCG2699520.1 hypothetical protein [Candidatus Parcubacteria bacterium]